MKKTLIVMMGVAMVATASFAQGTISFSNGSANIRRETDNSTTNLVTVSTANGSGRVELLWAPVGTTDINLFNLVAGSYTTVGVPQAGRFSNVTTLTVPAGTGFAGIAPGAIVSCIVRGWTGTYADWASAQVAWNSRTAAVGYSGIFSVDTGDPTTIPAGTPGGTSAAFGGVNFAFLPVVVPEPSTFALAGLGAAAMLIFRKRK